MAKRGRARIDEKRMAEVIFAVLGLTLDSERLTLGGHQFAGKLLPGSHAGRIEAQIQFGDTAYNVTIQRAEELAEPQRNRSAKPKT